MSHHNSLPTNPSQSTKKLNPNLWPGLPHGEIYQAVTSQPKKRIRQSTKPLLNKLEQEFQRVWFGARPYLQFKAQTMRFKLGNGIWYKPDFMCWGPLRESKIGFIEVKGPHAFRGGFENLKVAAALYPMFQWILAWKDNGQWQEQEVLA